jgi:hypothetical protein
MADKENYIIKHFNNKKETVNFYFLRWLAEINKNEKDTNYVCNVIAKYMHGKKIVLPFLDIFVVDNNVYIYTQYPGKWIGEKGKDVDELQRMINYNKDGELVHDFKLHIIKPNKTNFNTIMNFLNGYKKQNKN